MSAHLFAKTCAGRLYSHWSKDTQTEKRLKAGIYTNRICGEGEVAVSAIILDALSLDSKNIKVKCIPFFSLIKITSNVKNKTNKILALSIIMNCSQEDRTFHDSTSSTCVIMGQQHTLA